MLPTINQAVLSQVIQALKDGNVRYCEALGFDREELNELNDLTFEELMHGQHLGAVPENHHQPRCTAQDVGSGASGAEIPTTGRPAVQLGGSIALISHYFGISTAEISARRRLMGIHVRQGRNRYPAKRKRPPSGTAGRR